MNSSTIKNYLIKVTFYLIKATLYKGGIIRMTVLEL